MKINIDKIKARIASNNAKSKNNAKISEHIWRPTAKHVVRMVPYQFNPDDPFIPLNFFYFPEPINGKKSFLSPSTWDEPDPIVEYLTDLKQGGKVLWAKAREIEKQIGPKKRTYVPIIVRGEEDKGVRFWGFGKTVKDKLETYITNPEEYGDITDLQNGTDITVEFRDTKETGKQYPDTDIELKRKESPVVDPKDPKAKIWMEKITTGQPNILEIYTKASYEDLEKAMEKYLENSKSSTEKSDVEDNGPVEPDKIPESALNDTKVEVNTESPSAKKAAETDVSDIEKALDDVFPQEKK